MLDDRDYMKDREGGGRRNGGRSGGLSGTATLLIAILVVFFIQLNTNEFGGNDYFKLYVNKSNLRPIWMFIGLFSHIFMHSTELYAHIIFNGFSLFIFGRVVEGRFGKGAFIKLFIGSGVISGIVFVLSRLWDGSPCTLVGASGAIFGITAAAAMVAPNMEVLLFMTFPIKLKYLAPGYFIISLLAFKDPSGTAHIAHAGGLVGGFLLMHIFHRDLIRWTPLTFLMKRGPKRKGKKPKPDSDVADSDTIDEILDKIGAYGMKSLTKKEKRLLDQARSRMGKK